MPRVAGAERANRPKRTPLGLRNVLNAEKREGFVRRYFNDVDDRIERAKAAGYTPVLVESDASDPNMGPSQMGTVSAKSVGGGVRAVLMEIPEEFYQEDQAAKQARVDATETGLRPQNIKGSQYGGNYGGVEVTRKGRTKTIGETPDED